jgi:hypothetical protein
VLIQGGPPPPSLKDTVRRNSNTFSLFFVAVTAIASAACQSGGVGDPCVPEDEYNKNFSGYAPNESNVESQSFQCETRVCLVANFRGRVSCPYGQAVPSTDGRACYIPGTDAVPENQVTQLVNGWIASTPAAPNGRKAQDAVYCSCRCDGDDPSARYCDCPSGFVCAKVLPAGVVPGAKQALLGSYCVKEGTQVSDPTGLQGAPECKAPACGDPQPYGLTKK